VSTIRRRLLPLVGLLLLLVVVPVNAGSRPGYVYDSAYVLDEYEASVVTHLCSDVDDAITAEIVVVTLPDLNDYGGDINVARETIFNDVPLDGVTGIGKAGKDNGVLILISVAERRWGIEVGYGLEGTLTDSKTGRIGRNVMEPSLADGDYYTALYGGVAEVATQIGFSVDGYTPSPYVSEPDPIQVLTSGDWSFLIWWIFNSGSVEVAAIAVIAILALILLSRGRFGGGGGRSGGGGSSGRW
jgi:uncharacterized protein